MKIWINWNNESLTKSFYKMGPLLSFFSRNFYKINSDHWKRRQTFWPLDHPRGLNLKLWSIKWNWWNKYDGSWANLRYLNGIILVAWINDLSIIIICDWVYLFLTIGSVWMVKAIHTVYFYHQPKMMIEFLTFNEFLYKRQFKFKYMIYCNHLTI